MNNDDDPRPIEFGALVPFSWSNKVRAAIREAEANPWDDCYPDPHIWTGSEEEIGERLNNEVKAILSLAFRSGIDPAESAVMVMGVGAGFLRLMCGAQVAAGIVRVMADAIEAART